MSKYQAPADYVPRYSVIDNGTYKQINGTSYDDYIYAEDDTAYYLKLYFSGFDVAYLGAGDDNIVAIYSDTYLNTGAGDDYIQIIYGNSEIESGDGADEIRSSSANVIVDAGADDDYILLNRSTGQVQAGSGNDNIQTIYGTYEIDAGSGNDWAFLHYNKNTSFDAGEGDDTIRSYRASNENVQGGAGNDYLALDGSGTVDGGAGSDQVIATGTYNFIYDVEQNIGEYDIYTAKGSSQSNLHININYEMYHSDWFGNTIDAFNDYLATDVTARSFNFSDYGAIEDVLNLSVQGISSVSFTIAEPEPDPDPIYEVMGRQWHKTTFEFEGPDVSELDGVNPFRDYRLDVIFTHTETGEQMKIPGFYAGDGDAGNTHANSGSVWRAHLNAPLQGEWTYEAKFVTGENIAADPDMPGESAGFFDGETGEFLIIHSDKLGDDFRAKGMLEHDPNDHHLQHAGSGDYFIKTGVDSPENFLAYADFDNTVDTHQYTPHESAWQEGDPLWAEGKGQEIIGSVNYLAEQGVNSIYFLTMNVSGDGRDVWPWVDDRFDTIPPNFNYLPNGYDGTRYDVSKLDQWEVVFEHMESKGIMMHVVTQETENDQLLDGGELGVERSIYYRELIARFGHHNAITWNLGEENSNTDAQRTAFSEYIKQVDAYDHMIVTHTHPSMMDTIYSSTLGNPNIDGASLQTYASSAHADTKEWISASAADDDGTNWVVTADEVGPHTVGVDTDENDPQHNTIRSKVLWGNLMAGGAGVEWYFGYSRPHNDLNLEDFSPREEMYRQSEVAREFFEKYLPFEEMYSKDSLLNHSNDYGLKHADGLLVLYYHDVSNNNLVDLSSDAGEYNVYWFDPRNGGNLTLGDVTQVVGGASVSLGAPILDAQDANWNQVDYVAVLVRDDYVDEHGVFNIGQNIIGSALDDFLSGTELNDVILGYDGINQIFGLGGDDQINTGADDDFIDAGDGHDNVHAGAGNDIIIGGEGDDFINAGSGDDFIDAGAGNDQIVASYGNDVIEAGAGNDQINAGAGNDILVGGAGQDSLRGGAGHDLFVFTQASDSQLGFADIIEDFTQGEDLIDISQFGLAQITEEYFTSHVQFADKGYYQEVTVENDLGEFLHFDVITSVDLGYDDFML